MLAWAAIIAASICPLLPILAAQATTAPTATWSELDNGTPAPDGESVAYDSIHHEFVHLDTGGTTWTGDGTSWLRRAPAVSPPARQFASMAFDGTEVVLFGGEAPAGGIIHGQELDDTWTWDGTTWTQWNQATHPLGRFQASMARAGTGSEVVLFGGVAPQAPVCAKTPGTLPADLPCFDPSTWAWDGTAHAWTQYAVPAPRPRYGAGMAYDTAGRKALLFGGFDPVGLGGGNGVAVGSAALGDTWSWDGATHLWAQQAPAPEPAPSARVWAGMTSSTRGVVLYGGFATSIFPPNDFLSDTWTWNGDGWTQATPAGSPTPRMRPLMAGDGTRAVMFGGIGCQGGGSSCSPALYVPPSDESWSWDGSSWSPLHLPPLVRDRAATAFDATTGKLLVIGGRGPTEAFSSGGSTLADVWSWDGSAWTASASPSTNASLDGASAAFDAARGNVVLYSGATWTWDGSTWTRRSSPTAPPVQFGAAMAYDAARQRVVLFGGAGGGPPSGQTWTWDGSRWANQTPAISPPERTGASMAYDALQRVVLFGGLDADGTPLSDTWTWDGAAWTQQSTAIAPSPRAWSAMTYDAAAGRTVLVSGATCQTISAGCTLIASAQPGSGTAAIGDIWTWDGSGWAQVTGAGGPRARSGAGTAYDPIRQKVLLFGGNSDPGASVTGDPNPPVSVYLNDLWSLDPVTAPPALSAALSPATLSFGGQGRGIAGTPRMVILANTGTSPLAISGGGIATSPADYSQTSTCPASLAAGAFCPIMVTFTPTAAGSRPGTLSVRDNAPSSLQTVSLSGNGLPALGGDASALYLQGVTLLAGTAPEHLPDGGLGVCEAGPVSTAVATTVTGAGLPGCEGATAIPNPADGTQPNPVTAGVSTENVSTGGSGSTVHSNVTSLSLLPGMGVGGADVLDVSSLDARSSASCSASGNGTPASSSSIAGTVLVNGTRVATQPVGSRIIFNPTGKNPITLYGNPITVNPAGARVPMAVVTLNYSRYDPATNTQVSSPLEVEFPAGGALSSVIVGRVFISYAAAEVAGCR